MDDVHELLVSKFRDEKGMIFIVNIIFRTESINVRISGSRILRKVWVSEEGLDQESNSGAIEN